MGGEILLEGKNLLSFSKEQIREVRGKKIAMIFQEPMTSLNPVFTIGDQIAEAIILHEGGNPKQVRSRVIEMLQMVGLPSPAERVEDYPHQLSGGMRQRVMIAMALACKPDLLIADEPTTALDVTIQAQILDLLKKLQRELGMALLFITHDFGVVAEIAQRVMVMYAGELVEETSCEAIFSKPQHPYTQGLLKAIPPLQKMPKGQSLATIKGDVPSLIDLPKACYFQDRCPKVQPRCREEKPLMEEKLPGQKARCFFPG